MEESRSVHALANKPNPRISVVMAVHNGQDWLAQALRCIKAQTLTDFEFLIIDDGSVDRSSDFLRAAAEEDPRIIVHTLPVNGGLTAALRLGIAKAKGDFIARQDVDDFSSPDRLERCLAAAGPRRLLLSAWLIDMQGQVIREPVASKLLSRLPLPAAARVLRYVNLAAHGSFFFSREHYERIGGYRSSFPFAQDYDLLLRWMDSGEIAVIPAPLYTVRLHKESVSAKKKSRQYECARAASFLAWQRRKWGKEMSEGALGASCLHESLFRLANDRRYRL